jgi:hypothetical protein
MFTSLSKLLSRFIKSHKHRMKTDPVACMQAGWLHRVISERGFLDERGIAALSYRCVGKGQVKGLAALGQHTVPQTTVAAVGHDQLRGSSSSPFLSSPVYRSNFFNTFPSQEI